MKLKFSLLAAMMTVAAVAFTGCGKDDPTPTPTPTPTTNTIKIKTGDVTAGAVMLDVEPSDKKMTYMLDIFNEDGYKDYGSDDKIQKYVDSFIASVKESNPGVTTAQIIDQLTFKDDIMVLVPFLAPTTKYYAFAVGVNTEGKVTTALATSEFTTIAATGEKPEVMIDAMPGDEDGNNPTTMMTYTIMTEGAAFGKYLCVNTEQLEKVYDQGATDKVLLEMYGEMIAESEVADMNSGGVMWPFEGFNPGTSYTFLSLFVSEGGMETITSAEASTEAVAGAPSVDASQMSSVVNGKAFRVSNLDKAAPKSLVKHMNTRF